MTRPDSPLMADLPDCAGPVRILSDLHLGHDMSVVRKAGTLRPLIRGAARVIFNGDTLQERAVCFRARSLSMVEELQEMCRQEGAEAVFLRGNHDPAAWPLEIVRLAGGWISVIHGDIWLRLISPWSAGMPQHRPALEAIHTECRPEDYRDLERRFAILHRCRLALPPSGTRQKGFSMSARAALFCREIWPPRRPWEVLKAWACLPGLASEFARTFCPESGVLLFGHTHRARLWRRGGRMLVNTGAFVTFARPLMAEWSGGRLTVWRLSRRSRTGEDGDWTKGELFARPVAKPQG